MYFAIYLAHSFLGAGGPLKTDPRTRPASSLGPRMIATATAQEVRAKFRNPTPRPGETTGLRGWNGGGPDARYGTVPTADYVSHQNNEIAIICQIETPEAVNVVDQIAAVPGVDGLFFGPGDYAHRIGRLGTISHPEVLAAMEQAAAACRRHKRFLGTIGIGQEHYQKVRSMGAQLICPGGDMRVMNHGLRELVKSFATD